MLGSIKDHHIGAGLGIGALALLGSGIYSGIKSAKAGKKFESELKNWKQFGSQTLSKNLQRRLQKHLGIDVPIVTLKGGQARDYGVSNNAFFAPPPLSGELRRKFKLPKLKPGDRDPGIIIAGKKTMLPPIIAHELGHAKSYSEGKQPSGLANAIIGTAGMLGSIVGIRLGAEVAMREGGEMAWAPFVFGAAPAALSALALAYRTNKEENRASTKALEALARIKNRQKYLENDKKLLDTAYDTYKYGGRSRWQIPAAIALGGLGLGFASKHLGLY